MEEHDVWADEEHHAAADAGEGAQSGTLFVLSSFLTNDLQSAS